MTGIFTTGAKLIGPAIVCLLLSSPLLAELSTPQDRIKSAIRVKANGYAASGFLWGSSGRQVITSLHAVVPKPPTIEVFCLGRKVTAKIVRVLKSADLALLEVDQGQPSLAQYGCRALSLDTLGRADPQEDDRLKAYAFSPQADSSASSRTTRKAASQKAENLWNFSSGKKRQKLQALGMPDVQLPLYLVEHGIYPGDSGAPVFDNSRNLIGVVQGGLDAGARSQNFLVPASNIRKLLSSEESIPQIRKSDLSFSAMPSELDNTNSVQMQVNQENDRPWIKVKTRTFQQIIDSADPAEGLDSLLDDIFPEVVTQAEEDLAFDIYESQLYGRVIAVPAGYSLQLVEQDGDSFSLKAVRPGQTIGSDTEGLFFHYNGYEVYDGNRQVQPAEASFFDFAVNEYMSECSLDGKTCSCDASRWRNLDFGDGRKSLRVGMGEQFGESTTYSYANLSVDGNNLLISDARVKADNNSVFARCYDAQNDANCGQAFWDEAALMIAAHLTSFASSASIESIENASQQGSDLGAGAVCSNTNNQAQTQSQAQAAPVSLSSPSAIDTQLVTYFADNGAPAYRHVSGLQWQFNIEGNFYEAEELRREQWPAGEHVILQSGENFYAIPLQGGIHFYAQSGTDWAQSYNVTPYANQ